tara:strand:+ start:1430 stop:2635 length:1206 start_codon:yes stop_codon:yes gene_type:complete
MSMPTLNEQMDILSVGIEEIIPEHQLEKQIEKSINENKPLRVKFGCDPSRPDLHIGHAVLLRKLRQFQDFGHMAVLIIGDFTAMIGDPTGKNKTRPQLTMEETQENAKSYIDQATIVLSKENLEIVYNSEWLSKLNFGDVIKIASKYTVAQMLERDDFTKRYNSGKPISLHEFMYPLAQGYDSVIVKSDIELGGTDQKFNLLVGRALQKEYGQSPQSVITAPLLEGTDGVEKMSKSNDNYVALTDSADDMYGKILSIPDTMISKYYEFCTNIIKEDLEKITRELDSGSVNPRDTKRALARDVVSIYYDEDTSLKAEQNFDQLFISKQIPDDIPECSLSEPTRLIDIMVSNKLVSSNGEAKRMIKQGAVKLNDEKMDDGFMLIDPGSENILKVGKRRFLKIK